MALYPNGRLIFASPGRHFGAGAGQDVLGRGRGDRMNRFLAEGYSALSSSPDGYGVQSSVPAIRSGGLSCAISGSGEMTASGLLAALMSGSLTGSGNASAVGGLIVALSALVAGSGGISQAQLQGLFGLSATLTGSGGLSGNAAGVAGLSAALQGSGGINATASGLANLSALIRGYGDLTPEGIRDAIWTAVATAYDAPGSMGEKINLAGSGGVDMDALAAAVWAHAVRTLSSRVEADIKAVNGVPIKGTGVEGDTWGPA